MKQFYYQDEEGQVRGPATLSQLSAMMVEGLVNPTTLVVEVGGVHWMALGGALSCGYILPPLPSRNQYHNLCPRCKKDISLVNGSVPAHCPHCGFALSPESPGLWANFFFTVGKFLSLKGRTTRGEYWLFQLVFVAISLLLIYAGANLLDASACFRINGTEDMALLMGGSVCFMLVLVLWLLMVLPQISLMVRRLHDSGWSGWWVGLHVLTGITMVVSTAYFIMVIAFGLMKELSQENDCDELVVMHQVLHPGDSYTTHAEFWMNQIRHAERAQAIREDIEQMRPLFDFIEGTKGVEFCELQRHVFFDSDDLEAEISTIIPYESKPPHGLYISLTLMSFSFTLFPVLTLLLMVLTLVDSQRGPNRYGPSVKYPRG